MRAPILVRIAAQAELLRLRRMVRRQAGRAVLAGIAAAFLLIALAALHVAAGLALAETMRPVWAVLIVAGADLAVAALLLLLAARDRPGAAEREALRVRQSAQAELAGALAAEAIMAVLARWLRPSPPSPPDAPPEESDAG